MWYGPGLPSGVEITSVPLVRLYRHSDSSGLKFTDDHFASDFQILMNLL